MRVLAATVVAASLVTAAPTGTAAAGPANDARVTAHTSCSKPAGVQTVTFSARKYPHIRRHYLAAVRHGWPRVLVLNRPGTDARRERALRDVATKPGFDRDEYPPAVGRGRGKGLAGGSNPRGWKTDIAYVPSSENRSHGTSLGDQLRPFCDRTRFRYQFR